MVTKPPLCANNAGAPAVVALMGAPEEVEVELVLPPVAEALPLLVAFPAPVDAPAFPLAVLFEEVLPVDVASAAADFVAVAFPPVFVLDYRTVSHGSAARGC